MPRFYLHICDGGGFAEDDEGQEFADAQAARRAAIEGLRGILAEELRNGDLDTAFFVEIENEKHALVANVTFEDVVRLTRTDGTRPRRKRSEPADI